MNFKEWRDVIVSKPDSHLLGNSECVAGQFQTVFFKMRPAIMLNGFSSHQLQLIQQVLLSLELSASWVVKLWKRYCIHSWVISLLKIMNSVVMWSSFLLFIWCVILTHAYDENKSKRWPHAPAKVVSWYLIESFNLFCVLKQSKWPIAKEIDSHNSM